MLAPKLARCYRRDAMYSPAMVCKKRHDFAYVEAQPTLGAVFLQLKLEFLRWTPAVDGRERLS